MNKYWIIDDAAPGMKTEIRIGHLLGNDCNYLGRFGDLSLAVANRVLKAVLLNSIAEKDRIWAQNSMPGYALGLELSDNEMRTVQCSTGASDPQLATSFSLITYGEDGSVLTALSAMLIVGIVVYEESHFVEFVFSPYCLRKPMRFLSIVHCLSDAVSAEIARRRTLKS